MSLLLWLKTKWSPKRMSQLSCPRDRATRLKVERKSKITREAENDGMRSKIKKEVVPNRQIESSLQLSCISLIEKVSSNVSFRSACYKSI